jgi:bla regulator protein blaR1
LGAQFAGVAGTALKNRIEATMSNDHGQPLNSWRASLLATLLAVTIVSPLAHGVPRAARLQGQAPSPGANELTFEVASVKANRSGDLANGQSTLPGGRFVATNVTLRFLIQAAYGRLPAFRVLGGPGWIDSEHFDIDARGGGDPTPAQFSAMVRALLAERFHVTVRHETRTLPTYALVSTRADRGRGGQLRAAAPECPELRPDVASVPPPPSCGMQFWPGRLTGRGITMAQLSQGLSMVVNRVVTDRTGMTGPFDFDLEWVPAVGETILPPRFPGQIDDKGSIAGASIFTALDEQLGLKLDSTEGPVDVLVVTRAERPTAN